MNQRKEIYKSMIRKQHRRYAEKGKKWPGKVEVDRAFSMYPNILAELDASGETLEKLAEYAHVTPEIMAAVLEDGEGLTKRALRRLDYNLKAGEDGYLTEHTLRVIWPKEGQGIDYFQQIEEGIRRMEGMQIENIQQIKAVLEEMKAGNPVTYAAYRWAMRRMLKARDREGTGRKPVRAKRLSDGFWS